MATATTSGRSLGHIEKPPSRPRPQRARPYAIGFFEISLTLSVRFVVGALIGMRYILPQMKLYSRNQLVFSVVAAALVAALAVAGVFAISGTTGGKDTAPGDISDAFLVQGGSPPSITAAVPAQDSGAYASDENQNIRIYELYNEGVVNITTEKLLYSWFFDPVPQEGGTGSGSIIDKRGYVLTNHHVVEEAYKVFVALADGSRHEGEVIGTDPENDLAVIKFDPQGIELVPIPLGTSSDLRVGQKVLAIGNPFAFERTLTTGIISGLGRPVRGSSSYVIQGMIQTDASINPGNSGGPLLNSKGEMIGVNTMIYSPSGGSVGIGFASPIDTARRVLPDLIEYGLVRRGWLDIVPVQLEPSIVRYARLPVDRGVLVSRVMDGGNADKSGIKGGGERVRYGRNYIYLGGDIITEIDGQAIESISDFFGALESTKPGETVKIKVIRNGRDRDFEIVLSVRPANMTWD
jgi:S1-C subfamily serine protease